jgi:hypothetical protein
MALKLCTPVIGGTLSNLSAAVFVANCVPGAVVVVRSLTRPGQALVKQQIGAPDGYLPLEPGEALLSGDRLVVSQSDGAGASSLETDPRLAIHVGEAPVNPQDIPPVDVSGRLWECGRHAFVAHAIPGATVEILRNGTLIGSAAAPDGVARVGLTSRLRANEQVAVRQRAGAVPGPELVRDVEALPLAPGEPLPPPVIPGPVRACQTAVRIEGVFEGADVTLTRKSGEVETAPFDLSGLLFKLGTPLSEANGWIKARQSMTACERDGQDVTVDIAPPGQPGRPYVYPLCAGMVSVFIDNLERGAEVRIGVGADEFVTTASSAGLNRFDVAPLPAGTITVQAFLCGIASDAVTAAVDTAPVQIETTAIIGELFKCQLSVPVGGLKPGAIVQLWSKGPSLGERPISGQIVVNAARMEIAVTALIEAAEVWAVQWACALVERQSPRVGVRPAPAIDDPIFAEPVTRIDSRIRVKGTVRDARIEIQRRGADERWRVIGTATAAGRDTVVDITVKLAVNDLLRVRQRYCAIQSPGRQEISVVKPVPLRPVILSPGNGATIPQAGAVSLSWTDPAAGADADRKAESFDVSVLRNGSQVMSLSQSTTTATLPQSATSAFSAQFQLTVTPRNATGPGKAAVSAFKTPKAPDPQITATQDKETIKVSGSGFAASHDVEINLATEYRVLVGSPNSPREVNDNRWGKMVVTSTSAGTFDVALLAADVLEPRVELTGTGQGSQQIKAPPYPGATVKLSARNKQPIPASKGSANPSNTVSFLWSA